MSISLLQLLFSTAPVSLPAGQNTPADAEPQTQGFAAMLGKLQAVTASDNGAMKLNGLQPGALSMAAMLPMGQVLPQEGARTTATTPLIMTVEEAQALITELKSQFSAEDSSQESFSSAGFTERDDEILRELESEIALDSAPSDLVDLDVVMLQLPSVTQNEEGAVRGEGLRKLMQFLTASKQAYNVQSSDSEKPAPQITQKLSDPLLEAVQASMFPAPAEGPKETPEITQASFLQPAQLVVDHTSPLMMQASFVPPAPLKPIVEDHANAPEPSSLPAPPSQQAVPVARDIRVSALPEIDLPQVPLPNQPEAPAAAPESLLAPKQDWQAVMDEAVKSASATLPESTTAPAREELQAVEEVVAPVPDQRGEAAKKEAAGDVRNIRWIEAMFPQPIQKNQATKAVPSSSAETSEDGDAHSEIQGTKSAMPPATLPEQMVSEGGRIQSKRPGAKARVEDVFQKAMQAIADPSVGARPADLLKPIPMAEHLRSESLSASVVSMPEIQAPVKQAAPVVLTPNPALFAYRSAVVEQVHVGITRMKHADLDRITLQLEPADLGRVDVRMDVRSDGSTQVVFTAERSETLDMLQRDARGLERTLQEAGVKADAGSMEFNLRQQAGGQAAFHESGDGAPRQFSQQQSNESGATSGSTASSEAVMAEELASTTITYSLTTGLNMIA